MTQEEAYEEIARLGEEHALVHHAVGGVIIIVHPETQKEQGIYEHIQWVHGKGLHPKKLERERRGEMR